MNMLVYMVYVATDNADVLVTLSFKSAFNVKNSIS